MNIYFLSQYLAYLISMMNSLFGLLTLLTLLFLIHFLFKIDRNNTMKSISNNNIDSALNIEIKSNSIKSDVSTETVFENPIKMKNSFLNPNDDFGTLKKGVVLDNQDYEYEVKENDSSNFTIIEMGDESEEISE